MFKIFDGEDKISKEEQEAHTHSDELLLATLQYLI